jgi:hypothetical protein
MPRVEISNPPSDWQLRVLHRYGFTVGHLNLLRDAEDWKLPSHVHEGLRREDGTTWDFDALRDLIDRGLIGGLEARRTGGAPRQFHVARFPIEGRLALHEVERALNLALAARNEPAWWRRLFRR